jgi:hypothetical protein
MLTCLFCGLAFPCLTVPRSLQKTIIASFAFVRNVSIVRALSLLELLQRLPPTAQPLSARLNMPAPASDGAQSPLFGSIAGSPRLESLSASSSFTVARRSMFTLGAFPPNQRQTADAGSGEADLEPLSPPSVLPALPPVHPRSAPRPRLIRANSTIPKPFRLPGERFHEKAVADLEEKRRHSETVETSPRLYKARPMPDFSHDPRRRPPCHITE